ncbi:contractile injection system protein, VgrG/Pvc8 family [Burkholderia pseudomallei]
MLAHEFEAERHDGVSSVRDLAVGAWITLTGDPQWDRQRADKRQFVITSIDHDIWNNLPKGLNEARARAVRREPQSRVRAPRAAVRAGERRGYPLREHVRVRAPRRAACARVRSASRFAARASAHGHDCRRGGRRSVLRRRRPGARAGARPRSGGSRTRTRRARAPTATRATTRASAWRRASPAPISAHRSCRESAWKSSSGVSAAIRTGW